MIYYITLETKFRTFSITQVVLLFVNYSKSCKLAVSYTQNQKKKNETKQRLSLPS